MAYDPVAPNEAQQSAMFKLVPLGLLDTLVALCFFLFTDQTRLAALFLLIGWCGIWVILLYCFADDYLRSLRAEAARWCAVAIGLWYTLVAMLFAFGGNAGDGARFVMPDLFFEPQWPALIGAFVFELAFYIHYRRDESA